LTVAVLARQRAAMGDDQTRRVCGEGAVVRHAGGLVEAEVDTGVHATLTEVAVQRTLQVIRFEQPSQLAQIVLEVVGRDRGVFPALVVVGLARFERVDAKSLLAHVGELLAQLGFHQDIRAQGLQQLRGHLGGNARLCQGFGAVLDHQPCAAGRQQRDRMVVIAVLGLDPPDQHVVHRFATDRPLRSRGVRRRGGVKDVGIAEHGKHPRRLRRHQRERRAEDHDARGLATDQGAPDVKPAVREQVGKIITRDPARHLGEPRTDQRFIAVA
jgi:hypothetical protein